MDALDLFKKLTSNLVFEKTADKAAPHAATLSIHGAVAKQSKLDAKSITPRVASKNLKKKKKKKLKHLQLAANGMESANQLRLTHQINVVGTDCPAPIEHLAELFAENTENVDYRLKKLIDNFNALEFACLTPIQMQVMPVMANEREILACAPTGSGKTLAFLFPMLFQLIKCSAKSLILAPTKELAHQISIECRRISCDTKVNTLLIDSSAKSLKTSIEQCHVLITTPNRLIYLLESESSPGVGKFIFVFKFTNPFN